MEISIKNYFKDCARKLLEIVVFCFLILIYCGEEYLRAEDSLKRQVPLKHLSGNSVRYFEPEINDIKQGNKSLFGESSKDFLKASLDRSGQLAQNDPAYLSINRFEEPNPKRIKRVARKEESTETLRLFHPEQEKKLIFSGKGFEISDFEKQNDEKLNIDYHYHINYVKQKTLEGKFKPYLKFEERGLRDHRSLIFHTPITLMTVPEEIEPKSTFKTEKQYREIERSLFVIPETAVLLDQSPRYLLKLRVDDKAINLLESKQGWNRKLFYGH